MRAGGREIRNSCAEPRPVQALFEGADLWLSRVNRDWAGQPAGSSHIRNAPKATDGRQNVARREGPKSDSYTAANGLQSLSTILYEFGHRHRRL